MNSAWNLEPIEDPDWLDKLEPQLRAMYTLANASEEFLNKAIGMYRNMTMKEFPNASLGYILDSKGRSHVAIAVYDWKMEVTHKNQITRDPNAPQMLGTIFKWSDQDDSQRKLRTICEAWLSAFGRTKLADDLHTAIVTGKTIEQFGAEKGWPQ
jgi:hypothetical protein